MHVIQYLWSGDDERITGGYSMEDPHNVKAGSMTGVKIVGEDNPHILCIIIP